MVFTIDGSANAVTVKPTSANCRLALVAETLQVQITAFFEDRL